MTLGSEILREVREFERGSTAALNGYVQPIVSRYLGRLSTEPSQLWALAQRASRDAGEWRHDGGAMASIYAVHTVMSGPAAGAIAAARIGEQAGSSQPRRLRHGRDQFRRVADRGGEPT